MSSTVVFQFNLFFFALSLGKILQPRGKGTVVLDVSSPSHDWELCFFFLLLRLFARAKRSSRASCSPCWEKGIGIHQIGHSNYKEGQLRNCRAMRLPTEYGLSLYHFLCTMANSSTVFPRERRGGGRRRKERRMRKN